MRLDQVAQQAVDPLTRNESLRQRRDRHLPAYDLMVHVKCH
jgi:hypothetical protein